MLTPKYYYVNKRKITLTTFSKYYYNDGKFYNKNTGNVVNYYKNGKYNRASITDDEGKQRNILIGRAIASTLYGPPPSPDHTADHINKNPTDDFPDNIRWLCKTGQRNNQTRQETTKSSLIIVKDGVEKTAKDWTQILEGKNKLGRVYTESMILHYAQRKHHGFQYKKYTDLQGEVWKEVDGSKNNKSRWEISNMCRIKYITTHSENVIYGDRLCLNAGGYPTMSFGGKHYLCHIIAFKTFFPEDYASKKHNEEILHENDDKMDFRPHKLRIGTRSDNMKDAHDNGSYIGTKGERKICISYIDNVIEREHESLYAAEHYLKYLGIDTAKSNNIGRVLNGKRKTAYGRTWKFV